MPKATTDEYEVLELLDSVTKSMIQALEEFQKTGEVPPWNKPWSEIRKDLIMGGHRYPVTPLPHNIFSPKIHYSPLNFFILQSRYIAKRYQTNFWVAPGSVKRLGAKVKKDSKPVYVMGSTTTHSLYHIEDVVDCERALGITLVGIEVNAEHNSQKKHIFKEAKEFRDMLTSKLPDSEEANKEFRNKLFKVGMSNSSIRIESMNLFEGGDSAFYMPFTDKVGMPEENSFETEADYWATLFHESIHWTGHHTRCNRFTKNTQSESLKNRRVHYAKEELIAEMGSAYLCPYFGITNKLQHPEYLGHWIEHLKSALSADRIETHPLAEASMGAAIAFHYLTNLMLIKKSRIEKQEKEKKRNKIESYIRPPPKMQ